jgi:hypothetical protein
LDGAIKVAYCLTFYTGRIGFGPATLFRSKYMVPNPPLELFLPQLHGKLIKRGISPKRATSICQAILSGKKQRAIKTVEQYQEAWTVADASNEILTTIEDGSKLAAWSTEYNHALFDFEDAYFAKHGHMPLNPGPAEMTDGPTGRA